MTRILTVLYILCSLYTSPGSQPATAQDFYQTQLTESLTPDAGTTAPAAAEPGKASTPEISYLQELKDLGYYQDENKDRSLNARNAVLRFQSSFNMQVNGNWDDACMNVLLNRLSDSEYQPGDTIRTAASSGKWIVINKTKRILTLYRNTTVVKKYPVAVGNPPSLTPNGKFTMVSRVVNPTWGGGGYAKPVKGGSPSNPLGYRWMGLSYKDGGTLGIHGNNSPYSIGKNVSHGCIRMINQDVEELFPLAEVKMPVWIGTEKELTGWGILQPEYGAPLAGDF